MWRAFAAAWRERHEAAAWAVKKAAAAGFGSGRAGMAVAGVRAREPGLSEGAGRLVSPASLSSSYPSISICTTLIPSLVCACLLLSVCAPHQAAAAAWHGGMVGWNWKQVMKATVAW